MKNRENARKEDSFLMQWMKIDQAIKFATKHFYCKKLTDFIGDSNQVFQALEEVTGNKV